MQFTIATASLLAALAAASPASRNEARQVSRVTARFYAANDKGCSNPNNVIANLIWVFDTAPCHTVDVGQTVGCTEFVDSSLNPARPIKVYNTPDCSETGQNANSYLFPDPNNPSNNKFSQDVKSYRFL